MVNFRDPAVIAKDLREYHSTAKLVSSNSILIPPFDSGSQVFLALPGWSLLVSLAVCLATMYPNRNHWATSSWEFATTLDYEWGVIRGRRPYRWTIVVRNDNLLLSGFVAY
jgi:hypothetical protein